jgi:hypothetical protein
MNWSWHDMKLFTHSDDQYLTLCRIIHSDMKHIYVSVNHLPVTQNDIRINWPEVKLSEALNWIGKHFSSPQHLPTTPESKAREEKIRSSVCVCLVGWPWRHQESTNTNSEPRHQMTRGSTRLLSQCAIGSPSTPPKKKKETGGLCDIPVGAAVYWHGSQEQSHYVN